MLTLLSILACDTQTAPVVSAAAAADTSSATPFEAFLTARHDLSDVELLTRISLDLRGYRPAASELDQLVDDPAAMDSLIESYLQSPAFGARVGDLFSEVYRTRIDDFYFTATSYGLPASMSGAFDRSRGAVPLRILGHIADNDMSLTELVTGDWTMADELLAQARWPVDYPEGGTGWQKVSWTDDRPAAGVLATNAMWQVYSTNISNLNRRRANAVSRILLCDDHFARPIEVDFSMLSDASIEDEISSNPACVSCHVTLDPLAGFFYGFYKLGDGPDAALSYTPENSGNWSMTTQTPPALYGSPGDDLGDLGAMLAEDSRLATCAVETSFQLLLSRPITLEDTDSLLTHQERFTDSGLVLRELFASIVTDPAYRGALSDADGGVSRKLVSPDLLASSIEALTGFTWQQDGRDLLQSDRDGYRIMAGGVDGESTFTTATRPGPTYLLVVAELAAQASQHATQVEYSLDASDRILFTQVDFTETDPADPAVAAQIQHLYQVVLSSPVDLDSPEVAASLELWAELIAISGMPERAWTVLLTSMLRDPDFIFY